MDIKSSGNRIENEITKANSAIDRLDDIDPSDDKSVILTTLDALSHILKGMIFLGSYDD